jgi:hypothetical protein
MAMTSPSTERNYDELFRLMEEERGWAERIGTLSEAEMGEYRHCLKRIEELVLRLIPDSGRGL